MTMMVTLIFPDNAIYPNNNIDDTTPYLHADAQIGISILLDRTTAPCPLISVNDTIVNQVTWDLNLEVIFILLFIQYIKFLLAPSSMYFESNHFS